MVAYVCSFDRHFQRVITILEKDSKGFIWVKLCKNYFGLETNICICFIYTPKESVYFKNVDFDHFDVLESNIRKYFFYGRVAVIGDLNARCGSANDFPGDNSDLQNYIHNLEGLNNYVPDTLNIRKSVKQTCNSSGLKLIEVYKKIRFTHFKWQNWPREGFALIYLSVYSGQEYN